MPSSSRVVARVVSALFAGLGVVIVVGTLVGAGDRSLLLPAVGVFMVLMAAVVWIARGTSPAPGRRTSLVEVGGRAVLRVRLRPTTPLVMVLVGLGGSLLSLVGVLGVGLGEGGLLFVPVLALFLALVPDAVLGLRRRPHLELSAEGLSLLGWTIATRLAWDDVTAVTLTTADPRRPCLVVAGRLDAGSWRLERSRRLLPLDPIPQRPEITVLLSALDLPSRVQVLIDQLWREPAAGRAAYIDSDGVAFLAGAR